MTTTTTNTLSRVNPAAALRRLLLGVALLFSFCALPVSQADAQTGNSFVVQVSAGRLTAWTASGQLIVSNAAITSYAYNNDFLVWVSPNGLNSYLNAAAANGVRFLSQSSWARYDLKEDFFLMFNSQNQLSMWTEDGGRRIAAASWAKYEHRNPFFVHYRQYGDWGRSGDIFIRNGTKIVNNGTLAFVDNNSRLILVFSSYVGGLAPNKVMTVINDAGVVRGSSISISNYEFVGDAVRYQRPGSSTWYTIQP